MTGRRRFGAYRSSGRRPGGRFLTSAELDMAAAEVAKIAARRTIAIAGGYAMHLYGSDRLTMDLDVIARAPLPSLQHGNPLSFGGYVTMTPYGFPVDVILRADDFRTLYEDAVRTARWMSNVPIRVVKPEHLAAMKMAAGRPKDDLDLIFLLGRMDPAARARTRRVVRRFLGPYGAKDLELRFAEADWIRAREK